VLANVDRGVRAYLNLHIRRPADNAQKNLMHSLSGELVVRTGEGGGTGEIRRVYGH
jgi:hypothetical protein